MSVSHLTSPSPLIDSFFSVILSSEIPEVRGRLTDEWNSYFVGDWKLMREKNFPEVINFHSESNLAWKQSAFESNRLAEEID